MLHWSHIGGTKTTGYYMYANGTRVGSASSPPYAFYGVDCGATLVLGVQAHDESGRASKRYATSYSAPACGRRLASGVTLRAIDGGTSYFCAHHFARACNAGWDSPSFFPIATFNEVLSGSSATSTIDAYKKVGVNTFQAINYDGNPGLGNAALLEQLRHARMFVLGEASGSAGRYTDSVFGPGNQEAAPGYYWCDECDNTPNSASKIPTRAMLGETVRPSFNCGGRNAAQGLSELTLARVRADFHGAHGAGDPSRFLMTNYDQNWTTGRVCFNPAPYVKASDIVSYDHYVITEGYGDGPNSPWEQYDDVAQVRGWERQQGVSVPIWFDIEAPAPFPRANWSGVIASPALIAAETWDGLIAGARGVSYFDYDFCSPGCGYGTATGQGLTGSSSGGTYTFARLQAQVTETNGLVHLLAPILNSQVATGYVSSTVTGSGNGMVTMTKWEASASSDARCGNSTTGCFYVFSAPRFKRSAQVATYMFKANPTCPSTIKSYRLLHDASLASPSTINVTATRGDCQFSDAVASQTDVALYVIPNT